MKISSQRVLSLCLAVCLAFMPLPASVSAADLDTAPGGSERTNIGRDYRAELIGLWHASPVLGSGWASRFVLQDDGTFIYAASEMDGETRERFITGTWGVSPDGMLTLDYREILKWEGGEAIPATGSTGTDTEIIGADLVKAVPNPAVKVQTPVGNYIYDKNDPHPWSICFESMGTIWDGWWWKYESERSHDTQTLIDDYKSVALKVSAPAPVSASIQAAVSASAPAIDYTNRSFNFSLTLPASWAGLYRAWERSDGVSFIDIRNEKAGFGGFIFGIYVSDNTEALDWGFTQLTKSEGKYYFYSTPSDVQYAYENDSLTKEYRAMEKDIKSIVGTFRLIPGKVTAVPTASAVLVNGKNVSFDAYNINDNNYFKLRDLAYILNGTQKQFEVGWDGANNAISITSGKPYTTAGGEMAGKGSGNMEASPTSSRIYLDGKEIKLTAYNIGGNNYFKLRDIGQALNFGVDWNQAAQTVVINTSKGYTP